MMKFIKFDEDSNDLEDGQSTNDSANEQINEKQLNLIDTSNDFYPFCIVWSSLPFISFLLPWIRHAAICCSQGIIHDFNRNYKISIDIVPYGSPLKYMKLDMTRIKEDTYNQAIAKIDLHYQSKRFGFFRNNSHKYVADVLNVLQYEGKINWSKTDIFMLSIFKSRYTSCFTLVRAYSGLLFMIVSVMFINVTVFRHF